MFTHFYLSLQIICIFIHLSKVSIRWCCLTIFSNGKKCIGQKSQSGKGSGGLISSDTEVTAKVWEKVRFGHAGYKDKQGYALERFRLQQRRGMIFIQYEPK